MSNYFPADVSLRVSGELSDAQKLFPQAKQLLFRAALLSEAGQPLVKLFMPGADGSLIYVFMHQGLKHVYVQPGPHPVSVVEQQEQIFEEGPVQYLELLNGVVHPGTGILLPKNFPTDPNVYTLHEFCPTQICADVYQLTYGFQDMDQLGVESDPVLSSEQMQVRFPKPSNYSGAMKRIVQSIYALGKTTSVNGLEEWVTRNHYDYRWTVTDGILKVGTVFWLIRISRDDGVLAMPLPLFPSSTDGGLIATVEILGDTETYSILQEFGGLPTGETFPDNTIGTGSLPSLSLLDDAIAAGTVLQLMTKTDLAPFYVTGVINKSWLWEGCGWAFSDKGTTFEAHNTAFWYSNFSFANAWSYQYGTELLVADSARPTAIVAPMSDRCARAEHWKITFSIVNAVGLSPATGSATLTLVESGLLSGPAPVSSPSQVAAYPWWTSNDELLRVPNGANTDALIDFTHYARAPNYPPSAITAFKDLDCPIMVFYIDEILEVVRHQRERIYANGFVSGTVTDPNGAASGGITTIPGSPSYDVITPIVGSNPPAYWLDAYVFERRTSDYGAWQWYDDIHYHTLTIVTPPATGVPGLPDQFGATGLQGPFWLSGPPIYDLDVEGYQYDAQYTAASAATTVIGGISYAVAPFSWGRRWTLDWKRSGAFYATSLDARENRRYGTRTNADYTFYGFASVILDQAENWEQFIGLVVPAFTREGYLFVKWKGGANQTGLLSSVALPTMIQQQLFAPGLGTGTVPGPTLTPYAQTQWEKTVNAFNFQYAASINAGPTKCGVVQDGIYADIIFVGLTNEVLTPAASYLGTANGIDVTGFTARETTYVGAV